MLNNHSQETLKRIHGPIPEEIFKVKNFDYNGLFGYSRVGMASYESKFIKWTNDPGIAMCECSDGQTRLIPTFALIGNLKILPKQDMSNKVMFGAASHS